MLGNITKEMKARNGKKTVETLVDNILMLEVLYNLRDRLDKVMRSDYEDSKEKMKEMKFLIKKANSIIEYLRASDIKPENYASCVSTVILAESYIMAVDKLVKHFKKQS